MIEKGRIVGAETGIRFFNAAKQNYDFLKVWSIDVKKRGWFFNIRCAGNFKAFLMEETDKYFLRSEAEAGSVASFEIFLETETENEEVP